MKMRPIIATDVDGIIVKWQSGLAYFAQKYQLPVDSILKIMVEDKFMSPAEIFDCDPDFATKLLLKYNNSDFIRYLAPYSDAIKVVNDLKEHYDFVAITALGNSVDAHLNRQFNLNALFPGAFKDILVCDYNEPKDNLLIKVKEKYGSRVKCYIDDLPHHVKASIDVFKGTDVIPFWMPRESIVNCTSSQVNTISSCTLVKDWYQVKQVLETKGSVLLKEESRVKDVFSHKVETHKYIAGPNNLKANYDV